MVGVKKGGAFNLSMEEFENFEKSRNFWKGFRQKLDHAKLHMQYQIRYGMQVPAKYLKELLF